MQRTRTKLTEKWEKLEKATIAKGQGIFFKEKSKVKQQRLKKEVATSPIKPRAFIVQGTKIQIVRLMYACKFSKEVVCKAFKREGPTYKARRPSESLMQCHIMRRVVNRAQ